MSKLDTRIKIGTKIRLEGYGWYCVREIDGIWIRVYGLDVNFVASDIVKFKNK